MHGCSSWPVILASATNRVRLSGLEPSSITFIATVRSVAVSLASRIAPMPPCAITPPMSYFFSRRNSAGSNRFTAAVLGASDTSGGLRRLQPAEFDGGRADLDFLVGPEPRGFLDGVAVDESAVAAAEILDQGMIEIHRELRVPP